MLLLSQTGGSGTELAILFEKLLAVYNPSPPVKLDIEFSFFPNNSPFHP